MSLSDNFGDSPIAGGDAHLQEFLMAEKQKAQLHAQIHEFNELCWDRCVEKPSVKLDSKTETCLLNCVDRFIDVSLFITQRFAQKLEKSADAGGF